MSAVIIPITDDGVRKARKGSWPPLLCGPPHPGPRPWQGAFPGATVEGARLHSRSRVGAGISRTGARGAAVTAGSPAESIGFSDLLPRGREGLSERRGLGSGLQRTVCSLASPRGPQTSSMHSQELVKNAEATAGHAADPPCWSLRATDLCPHLSPGVTCFKTLERPLKRRFQAPRDLLTWSSGEWGLDPGPLQALGLVFMQTNVGGHWPMPQGAGSSWGPGTMCFMALPCTH